MLINSSVEVFEALERFPSRADFARFWSRMPEHPDYQSAQHATDLDELAAQYRDGGAFAVPEWRVVWQARSKLANAAIKVMPSKISR